MSRATTVKTIDARVESIRIGTFFVQKGDAGKCPHIPVRDWRATWRPDPDREGYVFLVSQRCVKCHDYLSQGPSDEAPTAVAVEIRAAEIAAEIAESDGATMTTLEQCGFNEDDAPLRGGGTVKLDTTSTRAGYLARCIVTHGGDR